MFSKNLINKLRKSNCIWVIILILITIGIYSLYSKFKTQIRENFTWTNESTRNFIKLQRTINPNAVFDTDAIQQFQASQEEVDYFNKHGHWYWSPQTKQLYVDALKKNPYIRTYSPSELKHVMTVYNEAAILKLLYYQSAEGQFLLNGVLVPPKSAPLPDGFGEFAYNSGELSHSTTDDVIKCNMNTYNLERTTNTKQYGLYGQQLKDKTPVDYNHLENIIPGFSFANDPCNPCHNIDATSNTPCTFKLRTKPRRFPGQGPGPSPSPNSHSHPIWEQICVVLWS